MLQQTQVPRVLPRWADFVDRWPAPADFAAAPLGDVLREWQGLGYPRRARHLHLAAQQMAAEHDGQVPDSLDALLDLPGIGAYTARAVLVFAFERDVGVVDTNIARILARTSGGRLTPSAVQRLADELVVPGQGWLWNQSLMDVGATVCRPEPQCARCPLASACRWRAAGRPTPDPATGSAGVSRPQARFAGSRRQRRGAVLRALGDGPQPRTAFESSIVDDLCADGLVEVDGDAVRLPH